MVWFYVLLFAGQFDSTFREGLVALNQNNLAVAETHLEEASRLEPRNARVWLALAETYWKLHQPLPTEAALSKAEAGAANDDVVRRGLSTFYATAGEAYYFDVAQAHLRQQDFAAALTALDAGRKQFDSSAQLELAAGVAYYGLRRFPEAIDSFLRTIELDPGIEQPYVFLGRMLDQAEARLPRITALFAEFAKRAPDNYLSTFLYAKALALGNQPGPAETLLRQSIARNGAFWESHFELGALLAGQRKWEDAAAEMQRAAQLNPRDAATHYHLARLYDRLGKPAEAAAERELHARLTGQPAPMTGVK